MSIREDVDRRKRGIQKYGNTLDRRNQLIELRRDIKRKRYIRNKAKVHGAKQVYSITQGNSIYRIIASTRESAK